VESAPVSDYGKFLAECYPWDYFGNLTLDNRHADLDEWRLREHVHRFFWLLFHTEAVRLQGAERVETPRRYGHYRQAVDGSYVFRKPPYVNFRGPLVRAWKRGRGRFVYAFAIEPHRWRKALHVHCLLFIPRYFNHYVWFGSVNEAWGIGGTKFLRPECQGDVTAYVAKYLSKGGEVEFSPTFESDRLRIARTASA